MLEPQEDREDIHVEAGSSEAPVQGIRTWAKWMGMGGGWSKSLSRPLCCEEGMVGKGHRMWGKMKQQAYMGCQNQRRWEKHSSEVGGEEYPQDAVSLSREVTASKQGSRHGSFVGGPEPAERGGISVRGAAVGPAGGSWSLREWEGHPCTRARQG